MISYPAAMASDEPPLERRNGFSVEIVGAESSVAFHESGHFVAAMAQGEKPRDVVIGVRYLRGECGDAHSSYSGYCGEYREGACRLPLREFPEIPDAPLSLGRVDSCGSKLSAAIICCAGPGAELKHRTRRGLPLSLKHSAEDDRRMLECFAQLERAAAGTDKQAFIDHAWREAQRLLDDPAHWAAVECLANALIAGLAEKTPETPRPGDEIEYVLHGPEAEAIWRGHVDRASNNSDRPPASLSGLPVQASAAADRIAGRRAAFLKSSKSPGGDIVRAPTP